MPLDIHQKLERVRQTAKNAASRMREKHLSQQRRVRLADLEARCHRVGGVELPLPSLFALNWLDGHLGGLETVNLGDIRSLGAIVWIFRHQHDPATVASTTGPDLERAIDAELAGIGAVRHVDYIVCVDDMLTVIKKNYISRQKRLLETMQRNLEDALSDSSPNGGSTSSPSPSATGSPSNASTAN